MALTFNTFFEHVDTAVNSIVSTSRSYTSGDLVLVLFAASDNGAGTCTIANSGTAQTWNPHGQTNTSSNLKMAAWSCVMSTTQSMTITVTIPVSAQRCCICVIPHNGQHATTPVPAGNSFAVADDQDGTVTQSITPTSIGSCLWMIGGDWDTTGDVIAPVANCTEEASTFVTGQYNAGVYRPTTQPRTDTSAFTLGFTIPSTHHGAYVALEVQAAAGGGDYVPRMGLLGVG